MEILMDSSDNSIVTDSNNNIYGDASSQTVYDSTITITQGGTTKGTFTLNQSTDQTINLDAGGSSSITISSSGVTDGTNTYNASDKLAKAVPTAEQGNKEFLYTFAGTTQNTDVALINDMTSSVESYTDKMVPTALSVATALSYKESTSNKVTSLSASSTDTQYPSAKCVYDLIGNLETLLNGLL